MSAPSIIYANARVNATIGSMLTFERFQRLIDCKNNDEAVKLLNEFGFDGDKLEKIFINKADLIYSYIQEASPIESVTDCFLKKHDYYNAKFIVKCKYLHIDVDFSLLYKTSNIDVQKLKDYIYADNYTSLPEPLSDALKEIDLIFSQGKHSSKLIDCLLTKAMYKDILLNVKNHLILNVFKTEIDLANLSTAIRIKINNIDKKAFDEEFIISGKLSKEELNKIINSTDNLFSGVDLGEYNFIKKAVENDLEKGVNLTEFEKVSDNYIINIFKPYKYDTESEMLFYGYIYGLNFELKNVKIVCGGVRAGLDKQIIKERMRDLYV